MDKLLRVLYREYGNYINSSRAFPLDLDGLKPVERRVLLTAYMVAREKFVKSVRIDGTCLARFHPHGSSYGTITQLVKQGLLEGQGNFGTDVGVESVGAAAARYTEAKLAKLTEHLTFKFINDVPWQPNYDGSEKEPKFLPAMFPMCLVGIEYTQGIGFGYKTLIPCYKLKDLQARLFWLLGETKTKPTIKPISDCKILSPNSVLEELLTTGKATLDLEGIYVSDPRTNTIIIQSWAPGRKFESILNKFEKSLTNGDIGFSDHSDSKTKILFEVLKQRNRDKIFEDLVKEVKIAVSGKISFETIVVDKDSNVKLKSIDQMLLDTFEMFTKVNEAYLNKELVKLKEQIPEYQALEKIRPYLSDELKRVNSTFTESISSLSKLSGIEETTIKTLLGKYRITKLLTLNTDISQLQEEVKIQTDNLTHLKEYVLKQYNEDKVSV
jgi:DNA gyrase/topoisomerase IV subunit A